ncbi:hypothetical protein J6590_083417 [Homalodisca vitripennis]|nr:hypothetical protein J6590_083417 [Homalodisca vitripennis]
MTRHKSSCSTQHGYKAITQQIASNLSLGVRPNCGLSPTNHWMKAARGQKVKKSSQNKQTAGGVVRHLLAVPLFARDNSQLLDIVNTNHTVAGGQPSASRSNSQKRYPTSADSSLLATDNPQLLDIINSTLSITQLSKDNSQQGGQTAGGVIRHLMEVSLSDKDNS